MEGGGEAQVDELRTRVKVLEAEKEQLRVRFEWGVILWGVERSCW